MMTMVQWKSSCDYYLFNYEHFHLPNLSSKMGLKKTFYRNIWNAGAGQRWPWRHWKILGMKLLIKYFKKSGVAPEAMLATRRSPRFPKPEKSVILVV